MAALPLLQVAQGLPHELHAHLHAAAALQGIRRRRQQHVRHLFDHGPHVRDVLHVKEMTRDNAVGLERLFGSSGHSPQRQAGGQGEEVNVSCLRPSGFRPAQKIHLCPASCEASTFQQAPPSGAPLQINYYSGSDITTHLIKTT